jgi:tetratricopeptide (TPR) repeat protein
MTREKRMSTQDLHGLALSTSSPETASAINHTIAGYIAYRADTPTRLQQLLAADPELGFAHLLKGYFLMLSFNAVHVPAARAALETAERLSGGTTARERAHIAVLARWVEGDMDATLRGWEQILDEHPLDLLAFRLHHHTAFWQGRAELMAAQAEKTLERWSTDLAGWPMVLACRCFAQEEMGNYAVAEAAGRAAIALEPGDLWAAHGVAHVLEMQGRCEEGLAWLAALEPNWDGGNNLKHHLWWHRALYHLEQGAFEEVLDLYDRRFRNLAAPLTQAQPDLYIDVQNAASMLFRLERQGVDVGGRWGELADKAEARIGDCLSVFTLPHWMMALTASGRQDAAGRMLEGMRGFAASGAGTAAGLVRDYAVPIGEALVQRARGEPGRACNIMRPALDGMYLMGGSHAQQDVLWQLFLDCALAARRRDDVERVLARMATRHPVPASRRAGYAGALPVVQ